MVTRTKEQKQQVNDTHCCVCFKLRTAILLSICTSILMIIVYGYEYWSKPDLREDSPSKFYGYICVAGIEFIFSIIGWIGVYNHIRSITKYFTYWTIIHLLIIAIIFWVSSLFDYLHFGFFIAWICIQILLLILLWKYKQILKMTYGWDDNSEEEEEEEQQEQQMETEPISATSEEPKKNNVTVSINLNMSTSPQQQMQMQPMPQYQPMPQPMPQPMMYQQPQQQYPPIPHNKTHKALKQLQNNAPNAPYLSQKRLNNLSDVAKQADPPMQPIQQMDEKDPNEVRIAVYSEKNKNEEIIQQQTTDYGDLDAIYEQPKRNRGNTNQGNNNNGESDNYEGQMDMIIKSETDMSAVNGGTTNGFQTNMNQNMATNQEQMYNQLNNKQRDRINTPDPPPPPQQQQQYVQEINHMEKKEDIDDKPLDDDFIVDAQPNLNKQQTQGVNLFFLDPGDNPTAGYTGDK